MNPGAYMCCHINMNNENSAQKSCRMDQYLKSYQNLMLQNSYPIRSHIFKHQKKTKTDHITSLKSDLSWFIRTKSGWHQPAPHRLRGADVTLSNNLPDGLGGTVTLGMDSMVTQLGGVLGDLSGGRWWYGDIIWYRYGIACVLPSEIILRWNLVPKYFL